MGRVKTSFNSKTASEAGKKSKRGVSKRTQVKQILGSKGFEQIKEQVIKNMEEALFSKVKAERQRATKDYADYFLPKKREHSGELTENIKIKVKVANN